MQRKKRILLIIVSVLLMVLIIGLTVFFSRQHLKQQQPDEKYISKAESDDITRYEWTSLLAEQYGLTEYNEKTPYFEDVDSDDPYFAVVQSAVEWKVLKTGETFDGDKYASGSFAALTAMRVIGQPKLQMYAKTREELSDREILNIALSKGLIEEAMLTEGISEKQSQQILQRLHELYYGQFSPKNYSEVTYQKDTVELERSDFSGVTDRENEIIVSENVAKSLQEGTIIIYEDAIGVKQAGKVKAVYSDGTVDVESAMLDEFLESLTASGQENIDFDDIVSYCRLTDEDLADRVDSVIAKVMRYENANKADFLMTEQDDSVFSIKLQTVEDDGKQYLNVILESKNGLSYELPVSEGTDGSKELEEGEEIQAELSVDSFAVSAQADYQLSQGLQYAEVAVDARTTMTGIVSVSSEKKMLLAEIPIPLAGGTIKVNAQIYLVVGMDGSIELKAELPMQCAVRYEKGVGFRKHSFGINVEEPSIQADCELNLILRGEPVLSVLGCNILDAEADIGMCTGVETIARENGQVCMDVHSSYPTVALAVLGDGETDSLLSKFGISASWELVNAEQALFQLKFHFERLNDGTGQFVEECTYKENEEKEQEANGDTTQNLKEDKVVSTTTYETKLGERLHTDAPRFAFDYPTDWTITSEDYPELNTMPWEEQIILSNERGAQITFTRWIVYNIDRGGRFMYEYDVSKVAESAFIPFYPSGTDMDMSYLAPFMVAKVKCTGELFMDTDEVFTPIDGGESYAVVPESYAGSQIAVGDIGFQEMLWFEYPQPVSFIAQAPDGRFSKDEEKEVIAILSSFRVE